MKNLKRSNSAHNRLCDLNNDKANNSFCDSKTEFVAIVKRDYHSLCKKEQSRLGRVLTSKEKTKLYDKSLNSLREYRRKIGRIYW